MLIKVKVVPNSRKKAIIKKAEDSFELKIKEKPIMGRANIATIEALANYFKVLKSEIKLVRGYHKKNKVFEIKK